MTGPEHPGQPEHDHRRGVAAQARSDPTAAASLSPTSSMIHGLQADQQERSCSRMKAIVFQFVRSAIRSRRGTAPRLVAQQQARDRRRDDAGAIEVADLRLIPHDVRRERHDQRGATSSSRSVARCAPMPPLEQQGPRARHLRPRPGSYGCRQPDPAAAEAITVRSTDQGGGVVESDSPSRIVAAVAAADGGRSRWRRPRPAGPPRADREHQPPPRPGGGASGRGAAPAAVERRARPRSSRIGHRFAANL